jgi:hypothetical protein
MSTDSTGEACWTGGEAGKYMIEIKTVREMTKFEEEDFKFTTTPSEEW